MNECFVLHKAGDWDDGMCACETGTIECKNYTKTTEVFGEKKLIRNYIESYLRKTGKSISQYKSTEELLVDFCD